MNIPPGNSFKKTRIRSLEFESEYLTLTLSDGRILKIPLALFPSLLAAKEPERRNFRLIGRGIGIHWPDLDEDISLPALLAGPEDQIDLREARKALAEPGENIPLKEVKKRLGHGHRREANRTR